MLIANRQVKLDDQLYHTGLQLWGKVTRFEGNAAEVTFTGTGGQRKLIVTSGGYVSGIRCIFWHEPLQLDEPYRDVSKFQYMIGVTKTLTE